MNVNQTKVTIPSNVADILEHYRSAGVYNEAIVRDYSDVNLVGDIAKTLRSIPFDTLLSALVNGYVREKTEAERHDELLGEYRGYIHGEDYFDEGYVTGVIRTLEILGITVVGINETTITEVSANV